LDAIQRNVAWKAIPVAAIVAGTVFLAMMMILNPIMYGIDSMFILRYFGSIGMGSDVLVESTTTAMVVGVLVHYLLSLVFTLVISIVVHRWGMIVGIVGGGLLGLAIYAINFYTMTFFFEWMFAIQSVLLVITHIVFGAVAGGVYEALDTYDEPIGGEVVA